MGLGVPTKSCKVTLSFSSNVWKWHQQNKRSLKRSVKWNGLNVEVSRWSSWKIELSTEPQRTELLPVHLFWIGSFLSEWLAALSGCCGCPCFQSESPQNWKIKEKRKLRNQHQTVLCFVCWLLIKVRDKTRRTNISRKRI